MHDRDPTTDETETEIEIETENETPPDRATLERELRAIRTERQRLEREIAVLEVLRDVLVAVDGDRGGER